MTHRINETFTLFCKLWGEFIRLDCTKLTFICSPTLCEIIKLYTKELALGKVGTNDETCGGLLFIVYFFTNLETNRYMFMISLTRLRYHK